MMNYTQAMKLVKRGLKHGRVDVTRLAWEGWPGVFLGMRLYPPDAIYTGKAKPVLHRIWFADSGFPKQMPWYSSECDRRATDWAVFDHITGKAVQP
jgi:hypothetical protein